MALWLAALSAVAGATELGIAHIGGLYALSEKDYLNEGADQAVAMGARCLKVNLSLDSENPAPKMYPFHSKWPEVRSLVELASTPYFKELLTKPFDTLVLTTFRPGKAAGYWRAALTEEDEQAEENTYDELTRYLLEHGNGKTFVLQNWEGDWAVRGKFDPKAAVQPDAVERMIRWLAARQRGVEKGRAAAGKSDSRVFHACEVNLVGQEMDGGTLGVTSLVLPKVSLDLVSYSAWDTTRKPERFRQALDFIAAHHRSSGLFPKGVYVGEFGLPETGHTPEDVAELASDVVRVAGEWGCPYAIYWQIYCNEPRKDGNGYKGFWLVRPDGSKTPASRIFSR